MKNFAFAFIAIMLSGCAGVKNPFSSDKTFAGISPPLIHRTDDDGRKKLAMPGLKGTADLINKAEAQPFIEYYTAMESIIESDKPTQDKIDDYVAKGITVVNVSCSRWFNSLAEAQARLAFSQGTQNVIQDLGTTLLGLGKANPYIVGTYGATFAGINGLENNFSQAFLLAPNANKVKEHIFTALDQQAIRLKNDVDSTVTDTDGTVKVVKLKRPTTFTDAYMALERYSDICTQTTAKEIVNSALDQTKTEILPDQGNKIKTQTPQSNLIGQLAANEQRRKETIGQVEKKLNAAATKDDYDNVRQEVSTKLKEITRPSTIPTSQVTDKIISTDGKNGDQNPPSEPN